jgi:hypothetical protein
MHQWMNSFDWTWMGLMMMVWILLIAIVGYAAGLAAWRHSNGDHAVHSGPKRA